MHNHSADCPGLDCSHGDLQGKQTQLTIALLLIGGFAVAEFAVGFLSHSLALVAEAGHMASDSLALVLALLATWATRLPQRNSLSDSLDAIAHNLSGEGDLSETISSRHPWEIWAACVNGIGLVVLSLWVGWEALQRLQTAPDEIASLPMLVTAAIGLIVNSINIAVLHQGSDHDLNLRAAFLHVLADALSSIGVIVAAIAVAALHWLWADGAISLFVAGIIFVSAIPLVAESFNSLIKAGDNKVKRT